MVYVVRRSRLSIYIGYFFAESTLLAILVGMVIIWTEDSGYLEWPIASISWVVIALFFHSLLFNGTFYGVRVNGESIEYHAFLRKTKKLFFSDIKEITQSTGMDMKIEGYNHKTLFYIKRTDQNFDRFMLDVSEYLK